MPRLIVNADDYGLTAGVNRGIEDLFGAGGLTSATLMAGAPMAEAAAEFATRDALLGVGCHVVLVDGAPLSDPKKITSLLQPGTSCFYTTLSRFLVALLSGNVRAEHIALEAGKQLQRLIQLGIQPTHVDTHKHLHAFPAVLKPLLQAAQEHGVTAVRNPYEPAWAVAASSGAPWIRKAEVSALRRLYREAFRALVAEKGFVTTDGAIGVAATGSLDLPTLESLLRAMPEGTWELVCHPGYVDAALEHTNTRLRSSRETEIKALQKLPALLPDNVELINYSGLRA